MYKGLEATGVAEAVITIAMAGIVVILVMWTFIGPGIEFENLWIMRPYFIIPIMNLAVFTSWPHTSFRNWPAVCGVSTRIRLCPPLLVAWLPPALPWLRFLSQRWA